MIIVVAVQILAPSVMLRFDLEAVDIDYIDESGRYADFHIYPCRAIKGKGIG